MFAFDISSNKQLVLINSCVLYLINKGYQVVRDVGSPIKCNLVLK